MDPVQIQQVMLNLAINGMDAMTGMDAVTQSGAPRELIIRSERHGDAEIAVTVEDRGMGVPEEIAHRIFDPFFSTKPQGTGMGLAICRSIVEAHDGKLQVESAAHGGAVFRFTVRAQS
jgi:signal transduction histidine kinase